MAGRREYSATYTHTTKKSQVVTMPTTTIIIRTASYYIKVALVFMLLGLILFVVGFATNVWSEYSINGSIGLWKACRFDNCYETDGNDFLKVIRAMECLALIGYGLAVVTLILYCTLDNVRRRDFMQAVTVFTFAGIICAGIGFAMANSNNRKNPFPNFGWSQGLALAGTVSYGVSGVMLLMHLCAC